MKESQIPDLFLLVWKRWRTESPVGQGVITQEQYWVLRTLDKDGPMRLKDLAMRLGCTSSTASIAVKRLERSGLVVRRREREDEREVRVLLTEAGRTKLRRWRADQLSRLGALFAPLSASERSQLETLLTRALGGEEAGDEVDPGGRKQRV